MLAGGFIYISTYTYKNIRLNTFCIFIFELLIYSLSSDQMRYILKCLFFFSLCPDIYVVSERVALLTHIIWCSAPVDCAVFYFSFSRSAVLNRYLEKLFYLAIFFFIFDECGFTMKDFDRGLFFPSAWWFCARLYEMLMCFSVQRKHWMMVLTFKGKMTDHRGFALVAIGRALFISNTSGFCIKLKQIYHRLVDRKSVV